LVLASHSIGYRVSNLLRIGLRGFKQPKPFKLVICIEFWIRMLPNMASSPQRLSDLSRLLEAKASAVARFLSRREPMADLLNYIISAKPQHNVVGIGIGPKITNGNATAVQ